MSGLWVHALALHVDDLAQARAFWHEHMGLAAADDMLRLPDGLTLLLCAGRAACTTRGPHGIVPALEVEDIAAARAYLRHLGRPVVFEEVVPGLARITFLDPAGNPIDLVQSLDVATWQRGARIPQASPRAPRVLGIFELSLYALDAPARVRFYRDTLGLATGLAYFAHVHLLFENVPLVVRPTWHRCTTSLPHTPALLVAPTAPSDDDPDLRAVCAGASPTWFDGEYTRVFLVPG